MKVGQTSTNQVQGTDTPATRPTTTGRHQASEESKKIGRASDAQPEISAQGREFARAKAAAHEAPDVREEKVAELKRRIAEGKYGVQADKIADRMVDEHLSTAGMG